MAHGAGMALHLIGQVVQPGNVFWTIFSIQVPRKEGSGSEGKRGERKTEEKGMGRIGCFPARHLLYSAQLSYSVYRATIYISS